MSGTALVRRAAPIAASNVLLSAFNLGSIVLLVRWFGAGCYADYVIDLAKVSLLALCLEVVPTPFALFRVQDEPRFIRGVAALIAVTGTLIAVLVAILGISGQLRAYSPWMSLYALLVASKRFFDLRLQSTGRLREFYAIETAVAGARIILMAICLYAGVAAANAIWSSLALANFVAQAVWLSTNAADVRPFAYALSRDTWSLLLQHRRSYVPYYLGIGLKKVRDNVVPLLAGTFFVTRESAGAFFLAYRGLLFTLGQLRVIEGLLNHRKTLESLVRLPRVDRIALAFVGQLASVGASVVLAVASGVGDVPWSTVAILSVTVWCYVFVMIHRADAYSRYMTAGINLSLATYVVLAAGIVYAIRGRHYSTSTVFAASLLAAEAAALYVLLRFGERTRATREPTPAVLQ